MPGPSRIVRTEEFYLWDRSSSLTPEELNRRFIDLHLRLQFAETEKLSDENLRQQVSDTVLKQSEAVIAGLRDRLLDLTQLEWLTSTSMTATTLVEGGGRTFEIPEADRALFTPGPYVVISREGSPDVYAVARNQGFDRDNGDFSVTLTVVVTPEDDNGPWSDWVIASLAGSTQAQMVLLNQGFEQRTFSEAAREAAELSEQQAALSAAAAIEARDDSLSGAEAALGYRDDTALIRDDAGAHRAAAAASAGAAAASAASVNAAALNAALILGDQRRLFFR